MKLFIWQGDGVLQDYTSGMIIAIADDLEGAHRAILAECDYCGDAYPHLPTGVVDIGNADQDPRAWLCWGGG